jgi:hypothetical protein
MKALLTALLVVATLTSTAFAKKATVDFTPFEGTYKGTYLLAGGTQAFSAAVTIKVSVPKSGKSLKLTPSGFLSAGGTTLPLGGYLSLGPGKKAQQLSVYFIPAVLPTLGTGSFSGKKNRFNATTVSSFSGTTFVSVSSLTFTKKGLNLTINSSAFGTPFTVVLQAKKKK